MQAELAVAITLAWLVNPRDRKGPASREWPTGSSWPRG
jgi:hypothetical protein